MILALASALCVASSQAQKAERPFRHTVLDRGAHGDCKALGDLNGDAAVDVILAGGKPVSRLSWYAAPRWTKTELVTEDQEFTTDMQVGDVDRDSDLDLLVPLGEAGELLWFENPRPAGDPAKPGWRRHRIGRQGGFVHDLEVADFDRNGRLDVAARVKDGPTTVWLQGEGAWTAVPIRTAIAGEGTTAADLNQDGRTDLVQNGYWLECPSDPVRQPWSKHPIAAQWPALARAAVGDLNGDGRADVVLAPSESAGRLSWFEAPPDPRQGPWTEHPVDASVSEVHGLQLADANDDGVLDIFFAEMAQSPRKRVGYYLNADRGRRWTPRVLSTSGSHNIRVASVGHPVTLLVLGCNWQGPPVELWQQEAP
jgi:hypothetical protein